MRVSNRVRGKRQMCIGGRCWDAELRWIWTNWIELKNRYGKRCHVCCERKVWRSDGEVGVRWDVLVWGRVGARPCVSRVLDAARSRRPEVSCMKTFRVARTKRRTIY